jgi:cysteine desulfurase family protein
MPEQMNLIYFDNAATSWPKPEETMMAANSYIRNIGASPGRSAHRLSIEAGRIVYDVREALAKLLGIEDPLRIVFTKNATEALNIAIFGLLRPGDHAITSSMEHNSIMRPLRAMEKAGVELSILPCSPLGELDPQGLVPLIRKNTRAVFLTHASNVTGTIMPAAEIGGIAHEHGLIFCLDAAQTAGAFPIDVSEMSIDLLAFTGHKSLFGLQGTGGLYVGKCIEKQLQPLMMGGTGSRSEFEVQPDFLPDRFESGTPNTIGLAGLGAGVRYILSQGVQQIRNKEKRLTATFLDGLRSIGGLRIYGHGVSPHAPIVSFNIDGLMPSEVALSLDEQFGIMSRPGLHCAPSAHRTIGAFPEGTVRFSFSCFNTEDEINFALNALERLTSSDRHNKG